MSDAPRLNSLFRIQTILILDKESLSGYEIAKQLEELTGDKPSSGKIYPFLHQLEESKYIEELEIEESNDRSKKVYRLTSKGHQLVDELLDNMGNVLDARLEQLLDICAHCKVKLYDVGFNGVDQFGKEAKFCCTHCRKNYYTKYKIEDSE